MADHPFQRFKQKESGARKKEIIRQEKKKVRQETREYFEQKKKAARSRFTSTSEADNAPDEKRPVKTKSFQRNPDRDNKQHAKQGFSKPSATQPGGKKPAIQKKTGGSHVPKGLPAPDKSTAANQSPMPLNKFISHSGISSRRDAAELVKSGLVTVNGKQVTEPGFKVTSADNITLNGKKLSVQKNLVYILLNKPKDFLTTTEDPQGRKTVMDIIKNATPERVYPVGRLDRNTTGVLLLTNDGELAQKLSHPSYQIRKIYEVKLDRPLTKKDFETILAGIHLEDGFIAPDALAYADSKDKAVIGIEIHSGRNRIVRRIFEKMGYDVRNLDRVMYANLTKKNVERGKWRFLQEKEVRLLKYLNASLKKNPPKSSLKGGL